MNANRPKRAYHRHAPEASPVARADEAVAVMDEAVTPRPEMRAEQRPAMREESSRDRAARRASEILGHMPDDNDAAEKFRVVRTTRPLAMLPIIVYNLAQHLIAGGVEALLRRPAPRSAPARRRPRQPPRRPRPGAAGDHPG